MATKSKCLGFSKMAQNAQVACLIMSTTLVSRELAIKSCQKYDNDTNQISFPIWGQIIVTKKGCNNKNNINNENNINNKK